MVISLESISFEAWYNCWLYIANSTSIYKNPIDLCNLFSFTNPTVSPKHTLFTLQTIQFQNGFPQLLGLKSGKDSTLSLCDSQRSFLLLCVWAAKIYDVKLWISKIASNRTSLSKSRICVYGRLSGEREWKIICRWISIIHIETK